VNVKKEHLTAITAKFSYAFGILSFINAPKPRSITEPSVVEGSDSICIYPSLKLPPIAASGKGSLTVEPAHGVRSNVVVFHPVTGKGQWSHIFANMPVSGEGLKKSVNRAGARSTLNCWTGPW